MLFSDKNSLKLFSRFGNLALSPRILFFFEGLELANIGCSTSIHFKNINLQYFAILLDKNIIFSNCNVVLNNYNKILKNL